MDLRWIDDFIVLARTRNFSRAAEERNVTQSTFSRRVRALENWTGARLIERSVPVALTPEGRAFLEAADPIARQLHHIRQALQAKGRSSARSVVFALPHTASITILPGLLREIEEGGLKSQPIRVVTDDLEPLVAQFTSGRCDFLGIYRHARIQTPPDLGDIEPVLIAHERLIPVSATSAKGRPRFALPGSARSPLPALMIAEPSLLGRALAHDLRSRFPSCWLQFAAENTLALALKPMVENGTGMAWLPESLVRVELASGTLVRAGDASWDVALDFCLYRAPHSSSTAAERIWALICKRKPPKS